MATGYYGFASKDEELRVHLVELAIGILRADPKEGVTPARGWAIEVIEKSSGIPFNKDDRDALLSKPIVGTELWSGMKAVGSPYPGGDIQEWLRKWAEEQNKNKANGAAPEK